MKTFQRTLVVVEDLKPFPGTLRDSLESEGWTLKRVALESLPQSLSGGADQPRGIVVSLLGDPEQGSKLAREIRRHESLRRVPLVVVGGDNEHLTPLKQELTFACFAEPGTLHGALKIYLPVTPG